MAKNKSKILWIIDALTIIFLIIQIQSTIARISPEHYWHYPLKEQLYDSIYLYTVHGWSEVLHDCLGSIVPWSKFLLFFANIYAVIWKIIGTIKRNVSSKSRVFIIVNLVFIVLKLIEFDGFLSGWMSV